MALVGTLCFCTDCGTILDRANPDISTIKCTVCGNANKNNWPTSISSTLDPAKLPSSLRQKMHSFVQVQPEDFQATDALTNEQCPECGNPEMYFRERQTRGADEGSTIYYTCPKCGHKHNTNN
ncbi:hypothetical protein ANO11243_001750 [Dothideomycetidae sp. 11243]|nr:hypothetical protein ANO11243_001750 [fungal sp. No.11243]